jgi:predicted outer membrane repeat protein
MIPSGEGEAVWFELDPVTWTVTVNAYTDDFLAATGSETFSITPKKEIAVTVKLRPVAGEGTGTLNYTLNYPDGTELTSFTLLADEEDIDLPGVVESNGDGTKTYTGSLGSVDSAYYLARAVLRKNGITVGKIEVVHIYRDRDTHLSLEFSDREFEAIIVVSSADSGPGTLRKALEDAESGATIVIDLPAADRVITLTSGPLSIQHKNLTILGNGTTLTQNGEIKLLTVTNAAYTTVKIRCLHFKGGRSTTNGGAISGNRLTLESCIFSDNEAAVYGGAVSGSNVTINGCTFYGNRAGTSAGAIYKTSGGYNEQMTIAGNLFWGNTAASHSVALDVTSSGYNISDREGTMDPEWGSGWSFTNGDKQADVLPISPVSFRPLIFFL